MTNNIFYVNLTRTPTSNWAIQADTGRPYSGGDDFFLLDPPYIAITDYIYPAGEGDDQQHWRADNVFSVAAELIDAVIEEGHRDRAVVDRPGFRDMLVSRVGMALLEAITMRDGA